MLKTNSYDLQLLTRVQKMVNQSTWIYFPVGLARSVIALGQLSILVATPLAALFVPVAENGSGPRCHFSGNGSIFCIADQLGLPLGFAALLVVSILMLSIAGLRPAIVAPLHYWATISISTSVTVPDGGEAAAQIAMFFLMLCSIGDRRKNHWNFTNESFFKWHPPILLASYVVLTVQMSWIYIQAGVAKIAVDEWSQGTAVYYVIRDRFFGASSPFDGIMYAVTNNSFTSLALTWGVIFCEITIGVVLLTQRRYRLYAFCLSFILHGAFALVLGLWSFAIIMIGAVAAVALPKAIFVRPGRQRRISECNQNFVTEDVVVGSIASTSK